MNADRSSLPVVNRCGECTACCSVLAIEELDKPEYEDCKHLSSAGCEIYESRPPVCQRFECMYLSDRWDQRDGGEIMRPDRCGLLIYGYRDQDGKEAIRVSEVFDGASQNEIAQQLIPSLVDEGYVVALHRKNSAPHLFRAHEK